jgi:hypothetical protein
VRQSQASGRLISPQGRVLPDSTGQWTVESVYATPGSSYEPFLVVTTSAEAAVLLSNQHARRSLVDHLGAMAQFML